ncbi:MAG: hypothetical protein H7311_07645 [Ramlibacter sp.]|nr:hypothetical protein [Cryobacterium sp.]
MSTDTRTPAIHIAGVVGQVISGPTIRSPDGGPRLETLADAVLRLLWQLVGAYVWLVLLAKRERPARR